MSANLNTLITEMSREANSTGPLDDRRVAVKDNICTADVPTTCASNMLETYVPPYDATVVRHVLDAGGTLIGKANMDEFGMGSTTETSAFGPTRNPVDPSRVPGGSSGGSAAAVASGAADLALGSDTGGSVRNPAAFCGVVGIKPTYGLVSRYGLVAYANSLEQIGPIGATVADAAMLLDVISGPDRHDATSVAAGANTAYAEAANGNVEGMTVGVPDDLLEGASPGVAAVFADAMAKLEAAGATVTDIAIEGLEHAVAAYYVIAMSEASSNLARFDGVRYGMGSPESGDWNEQYAAVRSAGFGTEVTRRILLGTFALSAGYQDRYYRQAQSARAWLGREFDDAFASVDLIASPTMPTTAYELGTSLDDPLQLYIADANTVPANLANLPAISVPGGDDGGLPVGIQFMAPQFEEGRMIRAASAVEAATS